MVFQLDSVVKEKIEPSWAQHFVPCTLWENMAPWKFKTPGKLKPKTLFYEELVLRKIQLST